MERFQIRVLHPPAVLLYLTVGHSVQAKHLEGDRGALEARGLYKS